jgi:hypothetical protein
VLTGEKHGIWSQENFPILEPCDANGNPIARSKDKRAKEIPNIEPHIYIFYKQDMSKATYNPNAPEKETKQQTDITSMDKSQVASDVERLSNKFSSFDDDYED